MSPGYRDKLKDAGVPGGNPYAPINARSVLEKNGKSWVTAKSNFSQVPVEAADKLGGDYVMHQLITFRQSEAMGRLERLCAKAEADTEIPHRIEAVGSTARTSDLDFSISGPNSHAVVAQFNAEFRASWGAESGVVLDTNIYTRSAHLDYPLTPKPGDVANEARIRIVPQQAGANAATSGGKEARASFEQKTLAGATSGRTPWLTGCPKGPSSGSHTATRRCRGRPEHRRPRSRPNWNRLPQPGHATRPESLKR